LLLILLFFAITGITLNHADRFVAEARVSERQLSLPALPLDPEGRIVADSPALAEFLQREFSVPLSLADVIVQDVLLLVDYRAPGKSTFIELDSDYGEVNATQTDYGLVATFNDLHKARDVQMLWFWLIDVSAILIVVFSVAGLVLLLPNRLRFRQVSLYTVAGFLLLTIGYWLGTA
jgi:uncharacterized protein